MSIRVKCPSCKKTINAGDEWSGRIVDCPGCGAPVGIPIRGAATGVSPTEIPESFVPAPARPPKTRRTIPALMRMLQIGTAPPAKSALLKCKDCGGQLSKSATVCPHCGKKNPTLDPKLVRRGAIGCVIAIALFGGCIAWVTMAENGRRAAFIADPVKQQQRKDLIDHLVAKGIFSKVEMRGQIGPDAWITPGFRLLEFDAKQEFCNVVYAYYFPDPGDKYSGNFVQLKDWQTGKNVGTYDIFFGLKLD